jgi:DNA polymerase-3 subunit alpha
MPTEKAIKDEILLALRSVAKPDEFLSVGKELTDWEEKYSPNGKTIIQEFYRQWKSGKRGDKNLHNAWTPYLLKMTNKAPNSEYFYKKRRNFARPSPPDIDSDFDYLRRPEILAHLVRKYGRGRVGNIGIYLGLKMRSALTRIIKALDLANAFRANEPGNAGKLTNENVKKVDEILGSLPKQRGAVLKVKVGDKEEVIKTTSDAYAHCRDFRYYMDKYPEVMLHAKQIEGLSSIFSVHASGIVLSDVPLNEIAPLRTAKVDGDEIQYATQYTYEDLELLGLVKFDILAISTLSVISRATKMIKENYGIDLDIENLPLNDQKTLNLYRDGNLTGVFQCESVPMQRTCQDIGVDRFSDIMAAISLFRPGPMDSIPEYCDRKHGRKKVTYFHPSIEPFVKDVLGPTYGVLTYQEQVMRLCGTLGDMTPTEALIVIKGIGKKKAEVIEKGHKGFVAGAVRRGVPKDIAEQYWEKFITPFASYGFNASHACAYAYLSYQTAYLKANYPEEFITSYLNVETIRRKHERVADLEVEAARMGIFLLARDINKCEAEYIIVKKKDEANGISRSEIRPPMHCKGLSQLAAFELIKKKSYANVREIAEKTETVVDAKAIGALCDAGFFRTKRDRVLSDFAVVREDMKSISKRNRESQDIFA